MAIGDGVATSDSGVALSGGQKFMKYSLYFVCFCFLIFAIVLIALGAAAARNFAGQLSSQTLPDGIIVMGVFILVVSLFGFFSAWKEWRPGLGIFFGIVLVLAIILIAVSIAVYVEKDQANYYLQKGWDGAGQDVQISTMLTFTCCGSADITEYNKYCASGYYQNNVPISDNNLIVCCLHNDNYTKPGMANNATHYFINPAALPCMPILVSDFNSVVVPAGSSGIAFSVLMLVSLVFIGLLMKGIRLKNLNLEVLKNRQRNEAERAERRKGIQLPDNVL